MENCIPTNHGFATAENLKTFLLHKIFIKETKNKTDQCLTRQKHKSLSRAFLKLAQIKRTKVS